MADEHNIETIDAVSAKTIMNEHLVVVDIRAKDDYELNRIEGAVHVDPTTFDDFLVSTPKETTILCYCYFGNSSINFCALLKEQGYSDVKSLRGGFDAWNQTS